MLQFITHHNAQYDYMSGAIAALKGGCKWIQLRMKDAQLDEIGRVLTQLKPICQEYNAILIIDDHVELVAEFDIDGVHLGKNDMPPLQARDILGEKYIIGGTANTFNDIVRLHKEGVDYIGLGPFRYTQTKQNLSPVLGIDGYKKILSQCHDASITTPIVAIGGIECSDIPHIIETGVSGIAMSGAILRSETPEQTTRDIIETLNKYYL